MLPCGYPRAPRASRREYGDQINRSKIQNYNAVNLNRAILFLDYGFTVTLFPEYSTVLSAFSVRPPPVP